MIWGEMANRIIDFYGGFVNWDERFFLCPDCEEPIYEEDYPEWEDGIVCPICEMEEE